MGPQDLLASPTISAVVTIAIVAFLCVRQLRPQSVNEDRGIRLVAVFGIIGVLQLITALTAHPIQGIAAAGTVASLLIEGLLGVWRGHRIKLSRENGTLTSKGTPFTTALWVLGLVVHFGTEAITEHIDPGAHYLVSASLLVGVSLSLGTQKFIVIQRREATQRS